MPIYVYGCKSCGSLLEKTVLSREEDERLKRHPPVCMLCRKPMDRKPGSVSVRFKGNGWSSPSAKAEN